MATNKNITMKQFNGTDYDTLYPKTVAAQIPDVFSKSETVNVETLSQYGLGASGTPNDVFGVLGGFRNGLGNEYMWEKGTYIDNPGPESTSSWQGICQAYESTANLYYADTLYDLLTETGTYGVLTVPTASSGNYSSTINATTTNKWVKSAPNYKVYFFNDGTRVSWGGSSNSYIYYISGTYYKNPSVDFELVSYVNSPDPNAYPPAVSDGYAYNSLGQLGSASHIEVISYVGTGTVGSNNPTSLTFKMPPKLFLIQVGKENVNYTNFLVARNTTVGYSISGSSYYSNNITWTNLGKTVSWYCTGGWGGLSSIGADAKGQMNSSGVTYTVIAFE